LSESERIHGYFKWVSPTWAATLYGPQIRDGIANGNSFSNGLLASLQKLPKHLSAMNRLLFLDAKHFLTDHNLNYTDKMSMAEGVEVRVPFLDVDLIAFVVTLPDQYKQRGFIGKWILRNAMETYLPKSVLNRPKTGFMVPIRSWFQNPVPEFLKDLLSEATVAKRQLFDPAGVQRMIEMNSRGLIDAAYPLLAIACVELWLQSFVDRSVPAQLTP
jgi:asparagine synthase (glutamine-hydrolysing)